MLDTNHLHFDASSFEDQPLRTDHEKQPLQLDCDRHAYHSLKEVLQLKLQQRRTREELVSQGIMPPLKSPAAFHEQRKSLERARTEDYLKRKIRSRPERSELVRMHILEETSVEPSLQAKQLKLKRARLADDLNDKISHRPGPIELIHKNILPVPTLIGSPKGEHSSLDEDSSDGLSPDQPGSQDSPLSHAPLHSPSDVHNLNRNPSPTQFLTQPAPSLLNGPDSSPPQNLPSGTLMVTSARPPTGFAKQSQSKSSADRPSQRHKKPKENKPKVKKLKYHQYIPPDQKNDREPPPQLDSSYAKILHQQQLFLQLQIISQQQQHYNYHTILPAPPKIPAEQQQQPSNSGPSPSRSVSTSFPAPSSQSGSNRQSQPGPVVAKPGMLPANLDEFKVAELKQELKLRGLTVSGTKNDLIERLKNYQEQNSGAGAVKMIPASPQEATTPSPSSVPVTHQSKDILGKVAAYPVTGTNGLQSAAPAQIMRFSSTSSSPPVSPAPSDRSLTGTSADEASCNGDVFGEMVSSPLTQLSLQASSEHLSPVKEEPVGQLRPSCCLSCPTAVPSQPKISVAPLAPQLDKDQMLQEKDKQIEQLTRMLRQKQQLVETLRSQLEQGKRAVTIESPDVSIKVERPALTNGEVVKVKEEAKEDMETSAEPQTQRKMQTQCSQQTLLKLQQIHRLQVQQQQQQQQTADQSKQQLQQQKMQVLQQQKLQQLIIHQSQQKQIQASQKKQQRPQKQQQQQKQQPLQTQQISQVFVNQQTGTQVTTSFPMDLLKAHSAPTLVTDGNGNHYLIALTHNSVENLNGEAQQNKTSGRITLQRLQSTPVKLPNQSAPDVVSPVNQSQQPQQTSPVKQPSKAQKTGLHLNTPLVQEQSQPVSAPPNLQPFFLGEEPRALVEPSSPLSLKGEVGPSFDRHTLFTPPPPKLPSNNLHYVKENGSNNHHIDDLFDILIKSGEISAGFKANPDPSLSELHSNPPTPSPSSSPLHLSPPTPPADSTPAYQPTDAHHQPGSETGRLEDFLESTTGSPLIGVEPDGPLTLIDDLHNQMLSTSSILDHTPTPMDTSELSFSPHPSSLDFEDGMDWLDLSMGGGNSAGGTVLVPLGSHTPPSVFSADFLDSSDLQLHWDSCL